MLNKGSLTLPAFVSCILAGIAMRNLLPSAIGAGIRRIWPSLDDGFPCFPIFRSGCSSP